MTNPWEAVDGAFICRDVLTSEEEAQYFLRILYQFDAWRFVSLTPRRYQRLLKQAAWN